MPDKIPLISVVTVVRNHRDGFQHTYRSLQMQSITSWEMIVIDGSSSDGTRELIESISELDSRVKLYPQNGLGIYSAMNEGIYLSKSEFIWFMNAGDAFYSEASIEIGLDLANREKLDLLLGKHSLGNEKKARYSRGTVRKASATFLLFNRRGTCHQSMIFRARTLRDVGGYNVEFRTAADFDVVLAIHKCGKVGVGRVTLSHIEGNGFSDNNLYQMYLEKFQIRRKHFTKSKVFKILNYCWTLLALSIYLKRRA